MASFSVDRAQQRSHTAQVLEMLTSGDVLGERYELQEVQGEGRFARVWHAADLRFEHGVAIKVLRPEFLDDSVQRERFAREARLMGHFDTPHIIKPTDHDVEGERPYIVMPLLKGETLRTRLLRADVTPVKLKEAYRILDELLAALAALHKHRRKVVHRDVKPENIFLRNVGTKIPQVVLIDFGVAYDSSAKGESLTRTEGLSGTPSAMAPEQLLGSDAPPHPRIDVHAAGLVAHELLSGEHYWAGCSEQEIADRCAAGDRPPPLGDTEGGKRIGVPKQVAEVVEQALALAPGRRHRNADDLRVDLRAAQKIDPHNLEVGSLFDGQFEIRAQLGKGGMGSVYRAYSLLDKEEVAIKILALPRYVEVGETDRAAWRERFRRERKIVTALRHPHIGHMFDSGEVDGHPYYTLELVDGRHFAEAAPDLGWAGTVRAVAQVADALDYAYGRGVTHRDIKSANILITPAGDAKVLDFGIARIGGSDMTRAKAALGTPGFRAPEQVRDARGATAAADQWALAATVYEVLTGEPPGGEPKKYDQGADTLVASLTPLTGREDIPQAIAAVLDRALEPKPEQRYPTSAAFAAALATTAGADVALAHGPAGQDDVSTRQLKGEAASPGTPFSAVSITSQTAASRTNRRPGQRGWLLAGASAAVIAALSLTFTVLQKRGASKRQATATYNAQDAGVAQAVAAPDARVVATLRAMPADAAPPKTIKLRVETWDGKKQRRGVGLLIGGTRYTSPAEVEVVRGDKVEARVESRRFRGAATWSLIRAATKKLALTRRRNEKKALPKPEPIIPAEVESYRTKPMR